MKKNQLTRALRVDKMKIAALEATLRMYLDEKEAIRRALEYDLIEIYKVNKSCIHDLFRARGEELDKQTTLEFFKSRFMDLYGRQWKDH